MCLYISALESLAVGLAVLLICVEFSDELSKLSLVEQPSTLFLPAANRLWHHHDSYVNQHSLNDAMIGGFFQRHPVNDFHVVSRVSVSKPNEVAVSIGTETKQTIEEDVIKAATQVSENKCIFLLHIISKLDISLSFLLFLISICIGSHNVFLNNPAVPTISVPTVVPTAEVCVTDRNVTTVPQAG